jgi:hypothetical protein
MYCTNDFEESLKQVHLEAKPVKVIKAWGRAEDADVCCHMDWSGGFVMELANGRYAYLSGWCDYTGWGCQDGAEIITADSLDALDIPGKHYENDIAWDENPADLNKWIADEMPAWETRL